MKVAGLRQTQTQFHSNELAAGIGHLTQHVQPANRAPVDSVSKANARQTQVNRPTDFAQEKTDNVKPVRQEWELHEFESHVNLANRGNLASAKFVNRAKIASHEQLGTRDLQE